MTLVLDLRIVHERWGSNTDPTLNGHLHYPNDLDKPLTEVPDKIRKYRTDYNNNPPNDISFMSSGVQIEQHDRGGFHYRHVVLSRQLKTKTVSILATCMKFIFHYIREAYSDIDLEID